MTNHKFCLKFGGGVKFYTKGQPVEDFYLRIDRYSTFRSADPLEVGRMKREVGGSIIVKQGEREVCVA